MDSWLEIIIRLPIYGLVLALLALVGIASAVVYVVITNRTNNKKIKSGNKQLLDLQQEFDDLKVKFDTTQEAHTNLIGDYKECKEKSEITREAYINFLFNISHEISNPLQSIQTNLDNMAHCLPEDVEGSQKYNEIISSDIRRLAEFTERLRALSRLETPNRQIIREPVNLRGVIETVLMQQYDNAIDRHVSLRYQGPDQLKRIMANRVDLEQVFTNIIENSIKYSKETGGEVIINIEEKDNTFIIRVIDNGIGIPEDDLPHIFDVAYRSPDTFVSRRKGTGLGLAIVKQIVGQYEGNISAKSELGKGTTITFELPLDLPPEYSIADEN
jgi:two-component system, OmpR family, phosphate regulon sensor histidine kinase PhoR